MFSSYFMLWISTKFLGIRALQVGVFIAFLEGEYYICVKIESSWE